MANPNLQQHFTLRAYDETPVTPNFVEVTLISPPDLPWTEPLAPTTTFLPGGKADANNLLNYVADETPTFEPIPFSLSVIIDTGVINALGNPRRDATWDVYGTTFVPVTVANIGTRFDSLAQSIAMPGPGHQVMLNYMYNLEGENAVPPGGSGSAIYTRWLGCVTLGATEALDGERRVVNIDGVVFGGIDTTATAFTTGTELTAP